MKKVVLMAVALLSFAMVSAQSAGEIVAKYNEGAAALQAKDWTKALANFESVVKGGADSEDSNVVNCVATAKKYIPTCYQRIGTAAAGRKDFAAAIENLTKAAEKAELLLIYVPVIFESETVLLKWFAPPTCLAVLLIYVPLTFERETLSEK